MIQSEVPPVYIHLPAGSHPPEIKRSPNRTVVVIEQEVSPEWQAQVSKWIVDSGCLFMMAWDKDCSSWDDSVDYANLEEFDYGEIPDDRFVMTTWHDNEPIEDAFWFCRYCAFHPEIELMNAYIVHISDAPREEELLHAYWTELPED
jgi:hypothetical protein